MPDAFEQCCGSTYQCPDADPDSDIFLMRIRILFDFYLMRMRIQVTKMMRTFFLMRMRIQVTKMMRIYGSGSTTLFMS